MISITWNENHLGRRRTSPEPVLKNLFFVPLCDFNLSSVGEVLENCLIDNGLTRVRRDDEATWTGRKKRARSDIVVCYSQYIGWTVKV